MTVYVLHRYWDTDSNEGNDIMGVYYKKADARRDMEQDAKLTRSYYGPNVWDDDMTWESEDEIHLGYTCPGGIYDVIYGWEIVKMEVQ